MFLYRSLYKRPRWNNSICIGVYKIDPGALLLFKRPKCNVSIYIGVHIKYLDALLLFI